MFNETEATEDWGKADATSSYSKNYGPAAAFKIKQKRSYWASKPNPEMPVFLWFRFNEIQRVSTIAFEEHPWYKIEEDNAYEVMMAHYLIIGVIGTSILVPPIRGYTELIRQLGLISIS